MFIQLVPSINIAKIAIKYDILKYICEMKHPYTLHMVSYGIIYIPCETMKPFGKQYTLLTDWEQNEWTKRKILAIARKMDMFDGIILFFVILCLSYLFRFRVCQMREYFVILNSVQNEHLWNLNREYCALRFPAPVLKEDSQPSIYIITHACVYCRI